MEQFLDTKTLTFYNLFKTRIFQIPEYQRNYEWGSEQILALWNDLRGLAEQLLAGKPSHHFFGPIFVTNSHNQPTNSDGWKDLIDGQQRVTTVQVLLHCMKERLADLPPVDFPVATTQLENATIDTTGTGKQIPRVNPHFGGDFYKAVFLDRFSRDERMSFIASMKVADQKRYKRFVNAYHTICDCLDDFLGDKSDPAFALRFDSLKKAIFEQSIVVMLEVNSEETAFQVFEVLNARGLDLSQADLVKNKILTVAKENGVNAATQADWESAADAIQSLEETDFITTVYYHQLAFHDTCKATHLYRTFCETTLPAVGPKAYASGLKVSCEYLRDTILTTGLSTAPLRDIQKLLGLKDRYPLLLLLSCSNLTYDGPTHQRVIRAAHHFAFRAMKVQKVGLASFQTTILTAARLIAAGDIDGAIKVLSDASPDTSFESSFATLQVNNTLGFYIMEMFEHYQAKGAGLLPLPQGPNQHVEHVLPKRPKDGEWSNWNLDEDHANYVGRVGNLTVLEADINQTIKNKSFAFKKPYLLGSKLHFAASLPSYADDNDEWTKDSIDRRQYDLAKLALDVWPIV